MAPIAAGAAVALAGLWANRRITDQAQCQTPEQRFAQHPPITPEQRRELRCAIQGAGRRRLIQHDIASDPRPATMIADALERQAIADALAGLGVFTIRSRPVRLPDPISKTG